jgi:hypothetical protein
MTDRLRIISLAICRSSKSSHIAHAFKLGATSYPVNTPKECFWSYLSNSAKDSLTTLRTDDGWLASTKALR